MSMVSFFNSSHLTMISFSLAFFYCLIHRLYFLYFSTSSWIANISYLLLSNLPPHFDLFRLLPPHFDFFNSSHISHKFLLPLFLTICLLIRHLSFLTFWSFSWINFHPFIYLHFLPSFFPSFSLSLLLSTFTPSLSFFSLYNFFFLSFHLYSFSVLHVRIHEFL